METAALCPKGRAQLKNLLWTVLCKDELCEMESFHRRRLSMCPG